MLDIIREQARQAITELLAQAKLAPGALFVVGCSTSEMMGSRIGKASNLEAALAAFEGIAPALHDQGIHLAAQCCEHLNRALILEREVALMKGFEIVNVVPQPNAGGAFPVTVYQRLKDPVAVEKVVAEAGIDIGGTLIGMHLRPVVVPVRLSISKIGEANILCARTRPRYIGGPRAAYQET